MNRYRCYVVVWSHDHIVKRSETETTISALTGFHARQTLAGDWNVPVAECVAIRLVGDEA